MNKKKLVFFSGAVMILAFALGSYFYKDHFADLISKMGKGNAEPFVREYSQTLGDKAAKVTLVEFMDPACETCRAFHPSIKNLMNQFPRKFKLVVRYAPFHRGADYCVKILEAAGRQGKYWETLDLLFKTQGQWTHHHQVIPERVWDILSQTELDIQRLQNDMDDPEIVKIIEQDLKDADTLKVKKTPSFFVNGKPLEKFGYNPLRTLLQSEIEKNY